MDWSELSEEEKKKKLGEVNDDFLKDSPVLDVTNTITHQEYLIGRKSGKVGHQYDIFQGEPNKHFTGNTKLIFNLLVLCYLVLPLLFVPLWAYAEHSWLFLIGIAFSYLGTYIATNFIYKKLLSNFLGVALFLITIYLIVTKGSNNFFAFYSLMTLYGFVAFRIADGVQNLLFSQLLAHDESIFNRLKQEKMITIFEWKA
jgi:hypothetical protein